MVHLKIKIHLFFTHHFADGGVGEVSVSPDIHIEFIYI